MDLKDIQELIKFVAKSGATEVDLEIDNVKISIKSPAKKKRGEKSSPKGSKAYKAAKAAGQKINRQKKEEFNQSSFNHLESSNLKIPDTSLTPSDYL